MIGGPGGACGSKRTQGRRFPLTDPPGLPHPGLHARVKSGASAEVSVPLQASLQSEAHEAAHAQPPG